MRKLLLLAVGLSAFSGCATLTVNKAETSAVKRAAIIGYGGQLQLEEEKKGIAATVGAIKGANDMFSGKLDARRREQAKWGYDEVVKRTNAALGWEFVAPETITNVPMYQQGLNMAGSMWKGGGYQYVDGILPPAHASRMTPSGLQQIAQALSADALGIFDITYVIGDRGGFAIGGIGSTTVYPQGIVRFTVFNKDGKEIWRDSRAVGPVAKGALRTTMGADIVENESEVINEATGLAIDALIQRYQQYQEPEKK